MEPNLGGWIFPGSKSSQLLSDLQTHGVEVESKIEGCVPAVPTSAPQQTEKRKRTEDAKAGDPAETNAPKDGSNDFVQVTETIRASVNIFQGHLGLDVRKFWRAGDGQMNPTAKGIRLKRIEFDELCRLAKDIDAACQRQDNVELKIGEDVMINIKEPDGGGPKCVDIRRYYKDKNDGELKPTKKGIWLSQKDWSSLKAVFGELTAVYDAGGAPEIPVPTKKPKKNTVDTGLSSDKLKQHVTDLLKGRDLQALSLKSLRGELEVQLKVPAGGLDARKDEIKGMVTDLLRKGS